MPSILDTLKSDHQQVKALFTEVFGATDAQRRSRLFQQLHTMVSAHSRGEEAIFYSALEARPESKSKALQSGVEHQVLGRLMEELSTDRDCLSDLWTARCSVLQELIMHHVDEEEGQIFTLARKLFDTSALEDMDGKFQSEKSRHMPPRQQHAAE